MSKNCTVENFASLNVWYYVIFRMTTQILFFLFKENDVEAVALLTKTTEKEVFVKRTLLFWRAPPDLFSLATQKCGADDRVDQICYQYSKTNI